MKIPKNCFFEIFCLYQCNTCVAHNIQTMRTWLQLWCPNMSITRCFKFKHRPKGCARYRNLILHITTRADDSHAIPNNVQVRAIRQEMTKVTQGFNISFYAFKIMVRFYVDYRIKPHVPPFVLTPANSVNFEFCNYTHLVDFLVLTLRNQHLG